MADTVEEVYNATIGNTAFSGGPVTVLTTDANTRYVIRDIDIERPQAIADADKFNMTAKINDVQIVDLTNGSAGGTSIMGPSSNLKLASTLYPIASSSYESTRIFESFHGDLTNSPIAWYSTTEYSAFGINVGSTKLSGREVTGISPSIGAANVFYYVDGKIFWTQDDGNSTSNLYRRVPGTSTNWLIDSASYSPKTYDNGTKFYWRNTASLFVYDAVTNATTSIALTGPGLGVSISSYARSFFANGYLFTATSSGGLVIVKVSNGVTYRISSPGISFSNDYRFAVGYDEDDDNFYYITLFNTTTNTKRTAVINEPVSTWNPAGQTLTYSTAFADENLQNGSSPAYVYYNYSSRIYMKGKNVYWRTNQSPYKNILSAKVTQSWLDASNISTVHTLNIGISSGESFYYQPGESTSAEIASEFPSFDAKVRITAVKSV